jgi:hypothetical protein
LSLPSHTAPNQSRWLYLLSALAILAIIVFAYRQVAHAEFVWDDIQDFKKMAWLRHGGDWQQLIFQRFNDWVAYFRPLGVALFALEVHLFGAVPGPMHLVSLLIHVINTSLVGLLAFHISKTALSPSKHIYGLTLPMLIYGLHPVLIEPVTWIGCQFDLIATLFMLLGWISNVCIKRLALRAFSVACCFFLAACAKESSIAFVPILFVLDWFALKSSDNQSSLKQLHKLLQENMATYGAVLLAGTAYLVLRHHSLGELIPYIGGPTLPTWARLQASAFLYFRYWQMFFWPTVGMGPIHPVDLNQFLTLNAWSLLRDVLAVGIVATSAWLTLRRSYLGALILCVTFALFPVLHVIAANFDTNLYHERYAMTALAIACAWFPAVFSSAHLPAKSSRMLPLALSACVVTWIAVTVMSIRVTVPLWSTQIALWQWALQENPTSIFAKDELISGYTDARRNADAWQLIQSVLADGQSCVSCMLNAANLALNERNPQRADFFLQKIKNSHELYGDPTSLRIYLTTIATVQLMEGNAKDAESIAHEAINLDTLDPFPRLVLAKSLAFQGRIEEAKKAEQIATNLMQLSERAQELQNFERLIDNLQSQQAKKP